jgi:hypothetical protein
MRNSKMRSRLFLSLAGAVALLAGTAAQAGTLTSASWLQVTQGFPMTRTFNRGLSQLPLTINGTSSGAASIGVNLTYPAFATKFFVPKTINGTLDLAVSITQGGSQSINATPGAATANQGVAGTVKVRVATHTAAGVNQSMYMTGMTTLVKVPVSAGVSGQFTGGFIVVGVQHYITVDFIGWTPGSVILSGLTSKGKPLPTVSAIGTWNLTAGGAGSVTLVSPSKISIDCGLAQRRTGGFTSLKLYFVPEPGTLLLLGAGGLGLVLLGSRKR